MQRACLLLLAASALRLAAGQLHTLQLPQSDDVAIAAIDPRWIDKSKCTKPGTSFSCVYALTGTRQPVVHGYTRQESPAQHHDCQKLTAAAHTS
jgi:hypothetical protein